MALAVGVNTSLPEAMSASEIVCPTVTGAPLSVSVPLAGSVSILTASRLSAGESFASVKPKSAAANVTAVSSSVVMVLSAPDGASLTGTTWIVVVAISDVSTPSVTVAVMMRSVVTGASDVFWNVMACKAAA